MASCLSCSRRPQANQHGLCDECLTERVARVRASLGSTDEPEPETGGGQATLDNF